MFTKQQVAFEHPAKGPERCRIGGGSRYRLVCPIQPDTGSDSGIRGVIMLESYIKFVKAHETILMVVLAAGLVFGVAGKVESTIAAHDNVEYGKALLADKAQADANAAIAAQVASDRIAFDALQAKMQAQDAALIQANTALSTALAKQQKTDDVMTTSQLIARWQTLVPQAKFDGAPMTPDGGVDVSPANAHATVDVLEQVPVLTQQLANSTQQTTDALSLLSADAKQVSDLNTEVSGLKLKAVDDAQVCKEQVKVAKDAARKGRRKWFEIGFVTGFLARQFVKTETGF
jgi:hypothetical protein